MLYDAIIRENFSIIIIMFGSLPFCITLMIAGTLSTSHNIVTIHSLLLHTYQIAPRESK